MSDEDGVLRWGRASDSTKVTTGRLQSGLPLKSQHSDADRTACIQQLFGGYRTRLYGSLIADEVCSGPSSFIAYIRRSPARTTAAVKPLWYQWPRHSGKCQRSSKGPKLRKSPLPLHNSTKAAIRVATLHKTREDTRNCLSHSR